MIQVPFMVFLVLSAAYFVGWLIRDVGYAMGILAEQIAI